MIRSIIIGLVIWSGTALAQGTSTSTVYCEGQCGTVEIESGHSRLLKLDREFSTVASGDDDMVSVNVMENHRMILITAKQKEGRTKFDLPG